MTEQPIAWPQDWIDSFIDCPACARQGMQRGDQRLECEACGHALRLSESGYLKALPQASANEVSGNGGGRLQAVSDTVKRFYEEHPFPNYDGFESIGDLLSRASRSVYAAMLDRQIPVGARILEIGCGTGQLGAFLSVGGRAVVGVDMSDASLTLATGFRAQQGLTNCNFMQGNLFELPLRREAFDLVICKGVLHHTADARAAFRAATAMVRPGGYVLVGLYNRIGRIPTSVRRWWFKIRPRREGTGDYVLRQIAKSDEKARSWFYDQYLHPHETRHTVDEVLTWFDENGLDYVNAVPPIRLGDRFSESTRIFEASEPGSHLDHLLVQTSWIWSISREGALFDMVARKPVAEA